MYKEFITKTVTWFGQCSLKFYYKRKTIFIDPYNIPDNQNKKADLILITHSHFDHLSFEDIAKVANNETLFYAPMDASQIILENGYKNVKLVEPNYNFSFESIEIQCVPMYNIVKTKYHPVENKWVGYNINFEGTKVYIAGDTERIPEMKNFSTDICFIPLGQVYTMNSIEEAVESVLDIDAKLAIPIHYGMYEGLNEDALKFAKILTNNNIDCMIIDRVQ